MGKKKELPIFSQLESFAGKQLLVPTHYSICHEIMYVFHVISKPFDLDLMRIRWIRTNSVGKRMLQRNYLASNIQEHWLIQFWQYLSLPSKYQATQTWNETDKKVRLAISVM